MECGSVQKYAKYELLFHQNAVTILCEPCHINRVIVHHELGLTY